MICAISTKASSVLTSSSGCTATLPAMAGATGEILSLRIFNGAALVAINDRITVAGLDCGTFHLPLSQLLAGATEIQIEPNDQEWIGAAQNQDISVSVPSLLGGAETTVLLYGSYF